MARTAANIKKSHYRVMHRAPAAFTSPADPETDASTFATWLASWTELGICRDKTTKLEFTEGDEEILDDGTKLKLGYNALLEFILLQSLEADYTAYEAIENIAQDIFLYDEVGQKCLFIPNTLLFFAESVVSGDVEAIPAKYEADNKSTKASFRTRFTEPLT